MKISEVPIPQVYLDESADFRFFVEWFSKCIGKIQYDIENIPDLYDPIRCPDWLLWMLAESMGFKYDDRLPTAFNRLVLVYFMSMIRNKGSKDGVTLAAETNLAQFNIIEYGKEKDILYNRLEDTSIPVNSVFVTPHTSKGYIEVVYFSDKVPIDACIEYVRPLGMYCFQHAGVRMDARDKIAIDARLTNNPNNLNMSIGPTHVGHYSREDYSRIQKVKDFYDKETDSYDTEVTGDPQQDVPYIHEKGKVQHAPLVKDNRYISDWKEFGLTKREVHKMRMTGEDVEFEGKYYLDDQFEHKRQPVYYRNSDFEKEPTENDYYQYINPGYRALYSLQISNNEHIVRSLIPVNPDNPDEGMKDKDKHQIFGLGYGPNDVREFTRPVDRYLKDEEDYPFVYNLRHDLGTDIDENMSGDGTSDGHDHGLDLWTIDEMRTDGQTKPRPAVNPIMTAIGDAMSMNEDNTEYILRHDSETDEYPPTSDPNSIEYDGVKDERDTYKKTDSDEAENLKIDKIKSDGEIDE